MSLRDFASLLLLSLLFGSGFLFIRIAAPVFGPLFLMDARVLLAAGLLVLWALLTKQPLRFERRWRDWLVVGALNAAIPYTLIAFAELHVSSVFAALFMTTLPVFTAVASVLWLGQRVTPKLTAGLTLGVVGVGILSGWNTLEANSLTLLSLAALLISSLSYALGIVFVSVRFKGTPPLTLSVGNFLAAGVLLLPFALAAPPQQTPSGLALLMLVALAVVPSALAFVFDFYLLGRIGPLRLSTVAYLIPLSGALLGVVFLGEAISLPMLLGFAIVLTSVALVTDVKWTFKKRLAKRKFA